MKNNSKCDVLVFTALVEEHRAVVEVFLNTTTNKSMEEKIFITIGTISVGIICLNGMGNVNSAALASINIASFNPKYVILCGIAGGVKSGNNSQLGDIIVAEQVVLYESSKIIPKFLSFGSQTERRIQSYRASRKLLTIAQHLKIGHWPDYIYSKLKTHRKNTTPIKIIFGPIASGEKVVANESFLKPIRSSFPTIKGIEMEAGGVSLAADACPSECESIVVKSICDWADNSKNDDWHHFASIASATFVKHMIDRLADSYTQLNTQEVSKKDTTMSHSSVDGLFIELLNPESQRMYSDECGLQNIDLKTAAIKTINASVFLCSKGIVFPIGTFIESKFLMDILPELQPLINACKIRFSIRESTISGFLSKRKRQYKSYQTHYPSLFSEYKNIKNIEKIKNNALINKKNKIGLRIAEEFKLGPTNLDEWSDIANYYTEDEINLISELPMKLVENDKPVTWFALKEELETKNIHIHQELRTLLQIIYCRIYASEYRLEYLQNVDLAPFQILPQHNSRRYDYGVLKSILSIANIWDEISSMRGDNLLALCSSEEHRNFMVIYDNVFSIPADSQKLNQLIMDIKVIFEKTQANQIAFTTPSNNHLKILSSSLYRLKMYVSNI